MQFFIFIAFIMVIAWGIWATLNARSNAEPARAVAIAVGSVALLVGLFISFTII